MPRYITGTKNNDVLTGTGNADDIKALGGDDRIDARGGDDEIVDGFGRDLVWAGAGGDTVYSDQGGGDRIYAGDGHDTVYLTGDAKSGYDVAYGGPGNDLLISAGQGSVAYGEGGFDIFNAMPDTASARWQGGPGPDHFELWRYPGDTKPLRVTVNDFVPGVDTLSMDRDPVAQFDVNRDGKLSKLDGMRVVLANGDYFHFKTDPFTNTQALELKIGPVTAVLLKVAELY